MEQQTTTRKPPARLLTTTRVAERLGVPVHRVEYVLRTRRYLTPCALAGNVRLFDNETLLFIQFELELIADRKAAKRNGGNQ